jgi:L-cysteine S-thiosulfotransferase
MRSILVLALLIATVALAGAPSASGVGQQRASAPADPANPLKYLMQGEEFLPPAVRAQQADDFDNPAFPIVEAGEAQWIARENGASKACQDCHSYGDQNSWKRVAASYPKYAPDVKEVITLQTRINLCRKKNTGAPVLADADPRMIAMIAYLRWLSRGSPSTVDITGPNAETFERGSNLYQTKMGRYQISCAQCHNDKFGKAYGGETLSQGHPLAYPVFKTGENRIVTLHERFRMCNKLARAEGQPDNSADYVALELFINWRSKNLPITAPGVRP